MNKKKIIIGLNIVFIALLLAVFLPVLMSGDEGYNTKTVAVTPAQQVDIMTEEITSENAAIEDEVVPEASAVNESASTAEATISAVETEVTDQPAEAVAPTTEATTSSTKTELYSVVDGNKLDAHSYAGFKLFRNWCARCHGTYGQGMAGPNLAESLKFISKEQFYDTVENGKSGRIGSMPSWNANVQVMENMDQLYAYLKARSDGAIGVEKPQKQ